MRENSSLWINIPQRIDDDACRRGRQTVENASRPVDRWSAPTRGDRRSGKYHQHPAEDDRLTPEAIRHRSIDKLPQRKPRI